MSLFVRVGSHHRWVSTAVLQWILLSWLPTSIYKRGQIVGYCRWQARSSTNWAVGGLSERWPHGPGFYDARAATTAAGGMWHVSCSY